MPYSYRSTKYQIPRPQLEDFFNETEERRGADIIDKALKYLTQFTTGGSGVVSEGTYQGTWVDNVSKVELQATTNPSIFAFINSIPIYTTTTLVWTGLLNNTTYYLYISLIEDFTTDPEKSSRRFSDVSTNIRTTPTTDPDYLLVAKVVTTDSIVTGLTITSSNTPISIDKIYLHGITEYDTDGNGIVDNTERLEGLSLSQVLNRINHLGTQPWNTIDTTIYKVSTTDLEQSERASLRFYEAFSNYSISGGMPLVSSNLTTTLSAQSASVQGVRVVIPSQLLDNIYVEQDNYIDLGSDGFIYYVYANRGTSEPAVKQINKGTVLVPIWEDCYRLFKITSRVKTAATGSITIQRRPSVGDTVTILGTPFIAVDSVTPGTHEFYIGATDTYIGWQECALSLVNAITGISCSASLNNTTIEITYSSAGTAGNSLITTSTASSMTITVIGLNGGHDDYISEVIDLRKSIDQYWKPPVETYVDLSDISFPSDGESRLVLDENRVYAYSKDKKFGAGSITFSGGSTVLGDKIYIGGVVAEVSIIEDAINKTFLQTEPEKSLSYIINHSNYPSSLFTSTYDVTENRVSIFTKVADSTYNSTVYAWKGSGIVFSGITNAGDPEGWVNTEADTSSGIDQTASFNIYKERFNASSGQTIFPLSRDSNASNRFVYKNGLYQEKNIHYTEIVSGIVFQSGLTAGDDVGTYVLELSGNVITALTNSVSRALSFVTVNEESDLPNSLDLVSHSVQHAEINHDSVIITDPGSVYTQDGTYEVLGDHIGDRYAHGGLSELTFYWKVLTGTGLQQFDFESSNISDYSTLLIDKTNTSASGIDCSFWAETSAGIFDLVYDSPQATLPVSLSLSGIGIDLIEFIGTQNGYRSLHSGASWTTTAILPSSIIARDSEIYANQAYVAGSNGSVYTSLLGTSWTSALVSLGVEVKSLAKYGDNLVCGTDGEVYSYHSGTGLVVVPIIDKPVDWFTALKEYGGLLFVGSQTPNKIYQYDGISADEDTTIVLTSYVTEFYEDSGRLYCGTYDGKVYEKAGVLAVWDLLVSETGPVSNFDIYDGELYFGVGKTLYKRTGLSDPVAVHTFASNIDSIIATSPYLYVCSAGIIYRKSPSSGWVRILSAGLDALYAGNLIKFVVSDKDKLLEIQKTGLKYYKWRQTPQDNVWYEYPDAGSSSDTSSNLGSAGSGIASVYSTKVANDFRFRRLVQGTGVTLSEGTNTITIAATGGTGTDEKVKSDVSDTVAAGYLSDKIKNSLEINAHKLQLVNDELTPTVSKYYGTNAGGAKGFHAIPLVGIAGIDIEKNASLITDNATIIRFSGIGVVVTDIGSGRSLVDIAGNENAGAQSFLGLTDVPITYVGKSGIGVRVNATETGLEFLDNGTGADEDYYNYSFFRSPGTTGYGIDGFREVSFDQTVYKVRARLTNPITSGINININRNGSPITGVSGLSINPGDYFADISFSESLVEDDILTCDVTQGSDLISGINITVKTKTVGGIGNGGSGVMDSSYDIASCVWGIPEASVEVTRFECVRDFYFPAYMDGSRAGARVGPTGISGVSIFSIQKDDVEFATFSFASGVTVATFNNPLLDIHFTPGNFISIIAPDFRDDALTTVNWTLKGETT